MDGRRFERIIGRLMKQDLSAGTEAFREDLLARCLEVLDADDGEDGVEVSDSDLKMLAAAGSPYALDPASLKSGTFLGDNANAGSPI